MGRKSFSSGDVLLEIDGYVLNSADDVRDALIDLLDESNFEVVVQQSLATQVLESQIQ